MRVAPTLLVLAVLATPIFAVRSVMSNGTRCYQSRLSDTVRCLIFDLEFEANDAAPTEIMSTTPIDLNDVT